MISSRLQSFYFLKANLQGLDDQIQGLNKAIIAMEETKKSHSKEIEAFTLQLSTLANLAMLLLKRGDKIWVKNSPKARGYAQPPAKWYRSLKVGDAIMAMRSPEARGFAESASYAWLPALVTEVEPKRIKIHCADYPPLVWVDNPCIRLRPINYKADAFQQFQVQHTSFETMAESSKQGELLIYYQNGDEADSDCIRWNCNEARIDMATACVLPCGDSLSMCQHDMVDCYQLLSKLTSASELCDSASEFLFPENVLSASDSDDEFPVHVFE